MSKNFSDLMKEITDWQDKTFTEATPLSAAEHLRREVKELIFDLTNGDFESAKAEMADCQLLLIAVAHLSEVDLELAVEEKMAINRLRMWGVPDDQGVVEHIREGKTLIEVFEAEGLIPSAPDGMENVLIKISKEEEKIKEEMQSEEGAFRMSEELYQHLRRNLHGKV